MPAYKLTRSQDWQQVRAPDWQRGAVTVSGSLLAVRVLDLYEGPSWPQPAPDLSGFDYPTGILPAYYGWYVCNINPSSDPEADSGPLTIFGGKITSGVPFLDNIPGNPRAWSWGSPAAIRPGGSGGPGAGGLGGLTIGMGQKVKVCLPLSGVLAYYHTQTWPVEIYPNTTVWPSDAYLATVAPDSASYVTIAPGSFLELIAPEADASIDGSSICQFWPGMVLSDFPPPNPPSSTYDGSLSTDDLPLSTA